jgi:hypothetical protein
MTERERVIPIIRRQAPGSFKEKAEIMQMLDFDSGGQSFY